MSSAESWRKPAASSSEYSSPVCAAKQACLYVVGSFRSRHQLQISCVCLPSTDGSLPQLAQARLSTACDGAPPSKRGVRRGGGSAPRAISSALSASRTSLEATSSSGCCSRSLASSGFTPRSGSATRSPRTASSRASDISAPHCATAAPPRGDDEVGLLQRPRRERYVLVLGLYCTIDGSGYW
eukprot:scaffold84601_cov61-Phaeocystis_antarctica.AAC.3